MKQTLSREFKNYFGKKGYVIQRTTQKELIIKLAQSLFPYRTQFDLIRLGPKGDGGYLVPNNLEGIEACFSPGVSDESGFELDCIMRNIKVYMADKSVERPNLDVSEDNYRFLKKFVGCTNNEEFITMDSWVNSSGLSKSSDLILQMDIEGAEYNSFINMSDSLITRFRIMIIEFHSLDLLWNPQFFGLAQTVFEKILQTHICVHNHPNNCCGIDFRFGIDIPRVAEFTFIRKDSVKILDYESNFPHMLDHDNTNNKSITLPKSWFSG